MKAFIYDAVRTPRGKARPDGGLAHFTPQSLINHLVGALDSRIGGVRDSADAMLLGCVGQIGAQGGHIAMVSKLAARLPETAVAHTINNYCSSGLTAIGNAVCMVQAGQAELVLAGGVEMMSRVPFMGDGAHYYTATDVPADARYLPVVLGADRLAVTEGIERPALDAATLMSQQRATEAEKNPALLRSRLSLPFHADRPGLDRDEAVRPETTAASLAAMTPAFAALAEQYRAVFGDPIDHRHTIANAPPVADGAGLCVIATEGKISVRARARVVAYAESGGNPRSALLGGLAAMHRALARASMTLADMERIEFMESFAVTIAKLYRDEPVDPDRVNVGGGHLAKGHPMGATGAILLSALLDALEAADATLGLVVTTAAAGVGAAMVVERLS